MKPAWTVLSKNEHGMPMPVVTDERPTLNDGISADSFSARSVLQSGVNLVPCKNPSTLDDGCRGRDILDSSFSQLSNDL